jgi:hypothetical protein
MPKHLKVPMAKSQRGKEKKDRRRGGSSSQRTRVGALGCACCDARAGNNTHLQCCQTPEERMHEGQATNKQTNKQACHTARKKERVVCRRVCPWARGTTVGRVGQTRAFRSWRERGRWCVGHSSVFFSPFFLWEGNGTTLRTNLGTARDSLDFFWRFGNVLIGQKECFGSAVLFFGPFEGGGYLLIFLKVHFLHFILFIYTYETGQETKPLRTCQGIT